MGSVRRLMILMGVYYFLQGAGGNPGFHDQSLTKFLKEVLQLTPTQASAFGFAVTLPWMIKPFYGIISDFLPIFGRRRKSYFILAGAVAALSFWLLSQSNLSYGSVMLWLCLSGLGFAFSDVLCDAVMVEKGQPLQMTDRLQAVQWTWLNIATLLAVFCGGYIAQYLPFKHAVLISGIFPLVMIVFTLAMLQEDRVASSGESAKLAWEGLKRAARSKPLWAAAFFIFLFQCNPHLSDAFYYYQKDILKFTDVTIGYIGSVGTIAFILGAVVYDKKIGKLLSEETLLKLIIITGAASNLIYLGFRNEPSAYLVSALSSFVSVVSFLGILTVAAKACPKYAEGTVFALIMSLMNFGDKLGGILGSKIYDLYLDKQSGFNFLIILSTVFTAAMWFLLPLARSKPQNPEAPGNS